MRFSEWLLLNEQEPMGDPMGGVPMGSAMGGQPPMGGPGGPPPVGGAPPMGPDPMGGMGIGGPGVMSGGEAITQSQLTKMKSLSAWDAIEEVLDGGSKKKDTKKDSDMVKQGSSKKHLMQ